MKPEQTPLPDCNARLVETLETSLIKHAYNKMNLNVDRFFESVDKISIFECPNTGYRYYYPFTIFGDDQFYQELYAKIPGYYYPDRWEYEFALNNIPAKSKVLEIGCGSGLFLNRLKEKQCVTVGLELNSKAVKDCNEKGLIVYSELIEQFAEKNKEAFDIVCSFQVLVHVWNIETFIAAALTTLKPGGLLIISVPNSNPYFFKHDKYHTLNLPPHHSGLWNKNSLTNLSKVFPIHVIKIRTEPLLNYKEWYIVQKEYLKVKQPLVGNLMGVIPRPIYKSITRLFSPLIEGAFITAVYQKQ